MEDPTHDACADVSHIAPLRASEIAQSQSLSDTSAFTSGSLSSFVSLSETSLSSAGSVNDPTTAGLDAADASEPKYVDLTRLTRSGFVKSASTLATRDVRFCRKSHVRFDLLNGNTQILPGTLEHVD